MAGMNIKKIVFNLVALCLSVILSLILFFGLLETYLRFKAHRNYDRTIRFSKDIFTHDAARKGYRLLPDRQYLWKGREFSYLIKSNSKGFRDREFSFEIPSGKKRIIVLGDSFTFGHGVENDEAYPKVLERQLAARGPFEVINAGIPANSLSDYIRLVKELSGSYRADIVMMGLHGGDISESIDEERKAHSGASKPGTATADVKEQPKVVRHFFIELKDYLRYRMLSYGFIVDKIKRNKKLSGIALKLKIINTCDTTCALNDEFSDPASLSFLSNSLDEYVRIARGQGMVSVLFFIPDKWYVAPKRFYSDTEERLGAINNILKKMCAEKGIVFLDPGTALKNYPDASTDLYYDYDYHFNRKGNDVFGKSLYAALAESGLLDNKR